MLARFGAAVAPGGCDDPDFIDLIERLHQASPEVAQLVAALRGGAGRRREPRD